MYTGKVAAYSPAILLFSTHQLHNSPSSALSLSIRPSRILLSCGIPPEVAANAIRMSVGRGTTKEDVDAVVEDLRETVQLLEDAR